MDAEEHDLGLSHDLPKILGRRGLLGLLGVAGLATVAVACATDDPEIAGENYLRGVQESDADGRVEFTSIFPACYDGRWPHMHFEVYPSLADATTYSNKLRTSQLALPQGVCEDVYATEGYEASVDNLARVSLDSDLVFADGHSLHLATVAGSVDEGYTVSLNVPV